MATPPPAPDAVPHTAADPETPVGGATPQTPGPSPGPAAPDALPVVDTSRYQVVGEHARGGLGRVLLVRDTRLGRTVAIKEALDPVPSRQAHFVHEALITARLQHPGIVTVYDAGRWPAGEPFLAMKLVEGRSLREEIAARVSLDERLELLPRVQAVFDAMAYAHSRQVLHLDLKPSNVLVGAFGETVVVDWGMARRVEPGRPVLGGGGTSHYMPPEQARGEPLDERADVYALGALLYETLAGVPPFDGTGDAARAALLAGPPAPVEQRQPGVAQDLAAIVARAMARQPAARFPSAQDLADDLRRFQTGQLVNSHRYSTASLLARWVRRHKAAVAVGAVGVAVVVLLSAVGVRRVVAEKDVALQRSMALILAQARAAATADPTASLAWLKQLPLDRADAAATRDAALLAKARGVARHVWHLGGPVSYAAFSPDGKALAVAAAAAVGKDVVVKVLDVEGGHERASTIHSGSVFGVSMGPDGRTLTVGAWENDTFDLWRAPLLWAAPSAPHAPFHLELPHGAGTMAATSDALVLDVAGSSPRELATGAPAVWLGSSPAGDWLVAVAGSGQVTRWETRTNTPGTILGLVAGFSCGAVLPDGVFLAGTLHGDLVSLAGGGPGRTLAGHTTPVDRVVVSPNGMVASFSRDGSARLWMGFPPRADAAWPQERPALLVDGHGLVLWRDGSLGRLKAGPGDVLARVPGAFLMASSTGGGRVLLADRDGGVHLATNGAPVKPLAAHGALITALAVSPDGAWAASSDVDGLVRVHALESGNARTALQHPQAVRALAFLAGGALVTVGDDGVPRVWDPLAGQARLLADQGAPLTRLMASKDGRVFAAAGPDGRVFVWEVAGGPQPTVQGVAGGAVEAMEFLPDGNTLVLVGAGGMQWMETRPGGAVHALLPPSARLQVVGVCRDGDRVAVGGGDGVVRVFDVATRSLEQAFWHLEAVESLACGGRDTVVGVGTQGALFEDVVQGAGAGLEPRALGAWLETQTTAQLTGESLATPP